MRTMESGYYDYREDIYICDKLDSLKQFKHLSYNYFLKLCCDFSEEKIVPLSKKPDIILENLRCARNFLQGEMSINEIDKRNHDLYSIIAKLEEEYRIQLFCSMFVNRNFLLNIMDADQQDDNISVFLNLMFDIKKGLCTDFYYLIKKI